MNILVSACLLGVPCRYDGKSKEYNDILDLIDENDVIPICPEVLGGLSTPRPKSEIQADGRVFNENGDDVTEYFKTGAYETLKIAKFYDADLVILKSKSPSCGVKKVYDGSFSGNLIDGNGITADLLIKNEFKVITEDELKKE